GRRVSQRDRARRNSSHVHNGVLVSGSPDKSQPHLRIACRKLWYQHFPRARKSQGRIRLPRNLQNCLNDRRGIEGKRKLRAFCANNVRIRLGHGTSCTSKQRYSVGVPFLCSGKQVEEQSQKSCATGRLVTEWLPFSQNGTHLGEM